MTDSLPLSPISRLGHSPMLSACQSLLIYLLYIGSAWFDMDVDMVVVDGTPPACASNHRLAVQDIIPEALRDPACLMPPPPVYFDICLGRQWLVG